MWEPETIPHQATVDIEGFLADAGLKAKSFSRFCLLHNTPFDALCPSDPEGPHSPERAFGIVSTSEPQKVIDTVILDDEDSKAWALLQEVTRRRLKGEAGLGLWECVLSLSREGRRGAPRGRKFETPLDKKAAKRAKHRLSSRIQAGDRGAKR